MDAQKEILIIDDERDFRLSIAEILVDQGFKVITARNGQEALNILHSSEKHPDLITVDMNMPMKDGIAFQEEIKQINPHIPLIMITGFLPKQLTRLTNICAFLVKPLDKVELLATIQNQFS